MGFLRKVEQNINDEHAVGRAADVHVVAVALRPPQLAAYPNAACSAQSAAQPADSAGISEYPRQA